MATDPRLAAAIRAQEREIDRWRLRLARAAAEAVLKHAGGKPLDHVSRTLVLSDLAPILDAMYGQTKGDVNGALHRQIVDSCREVRRSVFADAATDVRRRLAGEAPGVVALAVEGLV